jgi:hypothetical protein
MKEKTMSSKRLDLFASIIKDRFENYDIDKLSEDCIRYDYYNAICKTEKTKPSQLWLEYPHPGNPKKEIDCVVFDANGKWEEAIECKYFWNKDFIPRLRALGLLFVDFFRLRDLNINKKTVLLLVQDPMLGYIEESRIGFARLFSEGKQQIDVSGLKEKAAKTFGVTLESGMLSKPKNYKLNLDVDIKRANGYYLCEYKLT